MFSWAEVLPIVPTLLGVLVVLLFARSFAKDVRPIFINVIGGVAKNAQSNAMVYAIALLFGLTASFSAFIDVFKDLDAKTIDAMSFHQYAVAWVKVLNPFCVAIIAYFTKAPINANNGTHPPFASSPSTP